MTNVVCALKWGGKSYERAKQRPSAAWEMPSSVCLPRVTLRLSFRYLEGNHLTAVPAELPSLRHLTLV